MRSGFHTEWRVGVMTGGRQIGGSELNMLDLADYLYETIGGWCDVWAWVGTGGRMQIGDRLARMKARVIPNHDLSRTLSSTDSVMLYGTKLLGQRKNMANRINGAGMVFSYVGGFGKDYVEPCHLRVDSYWVETRAFQRYHVAHHGIPESMWVQCRLPIFPLRHDPIKGLDKRPFTFGVVGRLVKRKRVGMAIRAFRRLGRKDCRLVIVGDGIDRALLEALAEGDGRITFTGLIEERGRVAELIAGFDCLVHASEWEGPSRAVLEAMLLGTPVVATEGLTVGPDGRPWPGGIQEVVLHGQTGIISPPTTEGLLGWMNWVVEQPVARKCLAERARLFIEADNRVSAMTAVDILTGRGGSCACL